VLFQIESRAEIKLNYFGNDFYYNFLKKKKHRRNVAKLSLFLFRVFCIPIGKISKIKR
jgi:hypothetical protein